MASVQAIREALKTALATIDGLRPYDTIPPSNVDPAAIVAPAAGTFLTYDAAMAGELDAYRFTIQVLTAGDWRPAQNLLDGYMAPAGATSVKAAVQADGTLGGLVHATSVIEAANYGRVTVLESTDTYWGVEFTVEVLG